MFTVFRRLLVYLLRLRLFVSQAADSGWLRVADNQHTSACLRVQSGSNGDTRLLLDVALGKGWKTYWRSPGESGIAPAIVRRTLLEVNWHRPTPQRLDTVGISTQGYRGDVSSPMTLRGKIPPMLSDVLTLSICNNVCTLTDYPFLLNMTAPAEKQFNYDFTRAMGTLPLRDGLTSVLSANYVSGKLTVTARCGAGWQQPVLFIDSMEDVDFGKPSFTSRDDTLTVTVPVTDSRGEAVLNLSGKTLSLVLVDSDQAQESQIVVTAGSAAAGVALGWVLLMTLVGGPTLNVMPCVLSALTTKSGSLMRTERRECGAVRWQFFVSVCGIAVSFLALALMVTALHLGNQVPGRGIQLQNPWFIGAMALVMVLFSASLLGLFEIRLSSSASTLLATCGGNDLMGHFWQGAFATLLATLCTAPFPGTAVSVAPAAPLPLLRGIFFAMGIGMDLPWLLIVAWSGLVQRFPRSGRWMSHLCVVLGLRMLGSALWLVSLLTTHIGHTPVLVLLAILAIGLFLAIAWRYHWCMALRTGALVIVMVGAAASVVQRDGQGPRRDRVNWQPLSEQAIANGLAEHKRVFIDVTADWCATRKANKYSVLLRDDIQRALSASDMVALRGNWSRPSADVSQFLTARGNATVSFNQIYGPGLSQGEILPVPLDREQLLATLPAAKGK